MSVKFDNRNNFQLLGKDLHNLATRISKNETIAKLLHFTDDDPLSHTMEELLSEMKNKSLSDLVHSKILIIPKIPMEDEEVGGYIHISLDNFRPSENTAYKVNRVSIDIMCPVDKWPIKSNSLRIYLLMEEIDKMFNGKKLNGIGRMHFVSGDSLVLTSQLCGYNLVYSNYEFN